MKCHKWLVGGSSGGSSGGSGSGGWGWGWRRRGMAPLAEFGADGDGNSPSTEGFLCDIF